MIPMIQKLAEGRPSSLEHYASSLKHLCAPLDFSGVEISSLYVQAMFLEAALAQVDDLDAILAKMGRHTVTYEAVFKVCLSNSCRSTTPILFAVKFIDNFDLQRFLEELVEAILHQPYRGIMLP